MTQKIFKTRRDHVNSIGRNIADLMLPNRNYADSALIGQRGALANKYLSETEGQALENELTGHKLSAIEQALLDPEFKNLGIFGYSSLANPANAETLMKAGTEAALRGDEVEQAGLKTLAQKMLLGIGGRPPGPSEIELNVADEMEADERQLPEEVPWSMTDKLGAFAFLSNKAPGAGATFTEEDQLNLRASTPQYTLADIALGKQRDALTPHLIKEVQAKSQPHLALAEQRRALTPHLVGKTVAEASEINAKVDRILHGMELAEAESMQTQQKLINEGKLAEAKIAKVNADIAIDRRVATETILKLQAAKALNWAGVDKLISDIANNDMISAVKTLKIVEETNTEKLKGQHEQAEINRIGHLINNIKAHGKQQQNESDTRVDKTKAQITDILVKTTDDSRKTQSEIDLLGQQEQTQIQKTKLEESKDQGQRIENYNLLKSGASEPAKIKTGASSKSGDKLADSMGVSSGKYAQPLTVTDPDNSDMKYTLQPTMRIRLAEAVNNKGEIGGFQYLKSIGKTPKEQVLFMASQFGWSEDKIEDFLDSLN